MQHTDIEEIILKSHDLPAMAPVATEVIKIASDPEASVNQLVKVIQDDPGITARILKLSNSALFGLSRTISTLSDAVVVTGFAAIRSMVVAVCTHQLFKSKGKGSFNLAQKLIWDHSIATAVLAKMNASWTKYSRVEEAFIAGLLHDIGKLVFQQVLPDQYSAVTQEVFNENKLWIEVEKKTFGFTHAEVGGKVVKNWFFPESLQEAIGYHHNVSGSKKYQQFTAIIAVSNEVAKSLDKDIDPKELEKLLPRTEGFSLFNVDPGFIARKSEDMLKAVNETRALF